MALGLPVAATILLLSTPSKPLLIVDTPATKPQPALASESFLILSQDERSPWTTSSSPVVFG